MTLWAVSALLVKASYYINGATEAQRGYPRSPSKRQTRASTGSVIHAGGGELSDSPVWLKCHWVTDSETDQSSYFTALCACMLSEENR